MKTLKWFSLEYVEGWMFPISLQYAPNLTHCHEHFETEQQAFDWLEANGYIERLDPLSGDIPDDYYDEKTKS